MPFLQWYGRYLKIILRFCIQTFFACIIIFLGKSRVFKQQYECGKALDIEDFMKIGAKTKWVFSNGSSTDLLNLVHENVLRVYEVIILFQKCCAKQLLIFMYFRICPYFKSRDNLESARLVLLPYNYLMEKRVLYRFGIVSSLF